MALCIVELYVGVPSNPLGVYNPTSSLLSPPVQTYSDIKKNVL